MAEMGSRNGNSQPNPLEPDMKLEEPSNSDMLDKTLHPQQVPTTVDSAVTKAEKFERHGITQGVEESPSKRIKLDLEDEPQILTQTERRKGVAPIKKESVFAMLTHE